MYLIICISLYESNLLSTNTKVCENPTIKSKQEALNKQTKKNFDSRNSIIVNADIRKQFVREMTAVINAIVEILFENLLGIACYMAGL